MVYLKICLSEWKCLFMKKLPSCVVSFLFEPKELIFFTFNLGIAK